MRPRPRPTATTRPSEATRTIGLLGMSIPLPSVGTALYYGGIATLVAAELIDWPVAVAVAVGHESPHKRPKASHAGTRPNAQGRLTPGTWTPAC